ncbi:DNA-processing protein DprA [Pelagibius sp.]|uniref:DNA-processing protein DprA n=1 Tax=Pelagibius sp. TaxID=1931238 RepID=UPI0026054846|nr:DNA-processing protein DprA [Pelagibius sp.]
MTNSRAELAYKLLGARGIGPKAASKILCDLLSEPFENAGALTEKHHAILRHHLSGSQIDTVLAADRRLRAQIDDVLIDGGEFVTVLDDNYPQRLRHILADETPPVLGYFGNASLFEETSVGFCGSRRASEKGIRTAEDCVEQIVESGFVVVSGNAAGIDLAAHKRALECGGRTIFVLPEGLLRFRVKKELKDVWDWERVLIVSEFQPGQTWNAHQAMTRNKTIIGLSDILVAIEAGRTGGTIAAGQEALQLRLPVFAPVYEGMPPEAEGNDILVSKGARPLRRSKSTGRASLAAVIDELVSISKRRLHPPRQLGFGI